jgi:hypothetical protein
MDAPTAEDVDALMPPTCASIDSVLRGDLSDRRAGIECFAHR